MNMSKLYSRSPRLTPEDYLDLANFQFGRCAICEVIPKQHTFRYRKQGKWVTRKQGLVIDHNHRTGQLRGLLCNKCNIGIGYFGEDVWILASAIKYLLRTGGL